MIDSDTIKESLSYELLMQLAIMQHDIIQKSTKHEALMAQLTRKDSQQNEEVKKRHQPGRKGSVGTPGSQGITPLDDYQSCFTEEQVEPDRQQLHQIVEEVDNER